MAHFTKHNTKLEAALAYAAAGYRVLRVYGVQHGVCRCDKHSECPRPGKHPVDKEWQQRASDDPETLRKWFAKRDDYNIGMLTGAAMGSSQLTWTRETVAPRACGSCWIWRFPRMAPCPSSSSRHRHSKRATAGDTTYSSTLEAVYALARGRDRGLTFAVMAE